MGHPELLQEACCLEEIHLTVSQQIAERVLTMYEAAKLSGSLVSVDEIALLMNEHLTEAEIVDAISSHPDLNTRVQLRGGYITDRLETSQEGRIVEEELYRRSVARARIRYARTLAPILSGRSVTLLGIGGSSSYGSSGLSKDLDFFCVLKDGTLWTSLLRLLLVSRVISITKRDSPKLCFSCSVEESCAEEMFSTNQGGLFARDALQTIVLNGDQYYRHLLLKGQWMSEYFPGLFRKRVSRSSDAPTVTKRRRGWTKVLNLGVYNILSRYLRLKAWAFNRRSRNLEERFTLITEHDRLIFESRRYTSLRETYSALGSRNQGLGPEESRFLHRHHE